MRVRENGTVEAVGIVTSAGAASLDNSVVSALRTWRFPAAKKPRVVQVLFTFTFAGLPLSKTELPARQREGAVERVYVDVSKDEGVPVEGQHKKITAIARLHLGPDGQVNSVTFDQSSGYPKLDHMVTRGLGRWKFPTHDYDVVVVPLTFNIQPNSKGSHPAAIKQP